MKKGGGPSIRDGNQGTNRGGQGLSKYKKKNLQRLGGEGGLSLESFANAKARHDQYNPSLIKKKREFYKNAKYVKKYRKSLKQHDQPSIPFLGERPVEGENETKEHGRVNKGKKNGRSLEELYKKKHEEQEKARKEREAYMHAKKEGRERAEAQRKSLKEKMYKKTRFGQPLMRYRIEHLLETIQGSTS